MKYAWILFDADNTLFDYNGAESIALRAAFKELRISKYTPAVQKTYRIINEKLFKEYEDSRITSDRLRIKRFEQLFSELKIDADAKVFSTRYLAYLAECSALLPGALQTVHRLSKTHKLLLITNGLADVQRPRFARSKLKKYFFGTVISDEIGYAKPDARFFDFAFTLMGGPPKHSVLVVGDSLTSDIEGGIRYDIDTCWANYKNQLRPAEIRPTYEIQTLAGLIRILSGT
jgi:2-haloacid dehalogenase